MSTKERLRLHVVRQFHDPTGPGGHVAGWIMGRRPSNVARNRWAIDLLEVQPRDRVLELGCGPGVAVRAAAARATEGLVLGVDGSAVMVSQARRRNAGAVRDGRVRLVHARVEELPALTSAVPDEPFDAVLAVNNVGFWPDPSRRLSEVRELVRLGGRIALVTQPRCPGATAATSASAGDDLAELLTGAGFGDLTVHLLPLDPPAVCVLAANSA